MRPFRHGWMMRAGAASEMTLGAGAQDERRNDGGDRAGAAPHHRGTHGKGAGRRAATSVAAHTPKGSPCSTAPIRSSLLEQQAADRIPGLVPIRYGRMLVSPFAFYPRRGVSDGLGSRRAAENGIARAALRGRACPELRPLRTGPFRPVVRMPLDDGEELLERRGTRLDVRRGSLRSFRRRRRLEGCPGQAACPSPRRVVRGGGRTRRPRASPVRSV
jgi:hypothetical protein